MADFVDLKIKLCAHKFSFKCEEKWRVLPDDEREVPHSHPGHHTFGQYHFVPSSRSLFTGCDKITFSPGTQLQIVPNFVTLYWFCLYCCYKTRKVCFLTTNYGHNKSAELQNRKTLFSDHGSEGHHGYLLNHTKYLFSYHNSWPFAVTELQLNIAISFLKASGSKYMQLCRNHTHFESIQRRLPLLWRRGAGGQIGEQIRPQNSRYKLDYDCVILREYNKHCQLCALAMSTSWSATSKRVTG